MGPRRGPSARSHLAGRWPRAARPCRAAAASQISRARVRPLKTLGTWFLMPTPQPADLVRLRADDVVAANRMRPRVGRNWPVSILKNVLLPAPFGPIRQRSSPGRGGSRRRDGRTPPKRFSRPRVSRMGVGSFMLARAARKLANRRQRSASDASAADPRGKRERRPSGRGRGPASPARCLRCRASWPEYCTQAGPTIGPIRVERPPTITQITTCAALVQVEHLGRDEVAPDGVEHARQSRDARRRARRRELVHAAVVAQQLQPRSFSRMPTSTRPKRCQQQQAEPDIDERASAPTGK